MKVTVRTLDSKSTTFEVDEKATVKDFKEKIAPELGISAERQRVIFKGKVLHNEKLLKEYNVDGCVVHLVERPPPMSGDSSTAEARPTNSSNRRPQNGGQSNVFIGAFQGGRDEMGNATSMGDFYLPQIVESLMSSFGGGDGAATVSTTSVGDATAVNVQINMHSDGQHTHTTDAQMRLRHAQNFIRTAQSRIDALETAASSSMEIDQDPAVQPGTNEPGSDSQFNLTNSPQSFSRVIRNFQNLYQRLEPSLSRYRELLENPASEMRRTSDDVLPDGIAEILHNMSHALHALSDVTFNFQSPDPQRLSCLPRMNPVSVPPPSHSHPPRSNAPPSSSNAPPSSSNAPPSSSSTQPPNSNTQTESTAATTSSGPRNGGQPFVQFSSFVQNLGQQSGLGNVSSSNAQSQPSRPIITPQVVRPIGVSATVIQIPTHLRTVRTAASQQHSSVSMGTTTATPNVSSTPSARTSTGTTFSSGSFSSGSFSPMDFASMFSAATSQASHSTSTSSTQTRPNPSQRPMATPHLPRLPFGLDAFNSNSVIGHPDPAVPCQSFHFGPRFQQGGEATGRPQIVAELSSVVIEHIHNGMPTNAPATSAASTTSTPASAGNRGGQASSVFHGMTSAQPSSRTSGQVPSNQSQPSQQQTQQSDDAAFGPRIYEVVQRAIMNALMGQSQDRRNGPTIRDLIGEEFRDLQSSDESQSSDFISQLLDHLSDHMTVDDIIELAAGSSLRPLRRLAPHIRQFIETRFNSGEPLTRSNVPRVVDTIMGSGLRITTEAVATLTVRPDIDLEATIFRLDKEVLNDALISLLDYDRGDFPDEFANLFYRYLAISIAVLDNCVEGNAEAYINAVAGSERLLTTMRMLNSVNPEMRNFCIDFMISKLRSAAANAPRVTEEEVRRRCIKKVDKNKEASSSVSDTLPRASGPVDEKMDVEKRWNELYGNRNADSSDDEGDASTSQPHEWHRHVPPEWIAVITKDAKRQRSKTPQRPFSDAYCSGLPAKRRKAVKPDEDSQIDFNVALQNSIKSAKVEPKTSLSDLSKDLDSEELRASFQETLRKDTRKRLEKDPDYKPEKFPNSDEYFFPDK
ncbi:large proline-rich protein bag6-like [Rhopilema esculentum]|uniref:large proline-rich protein bag6-like n=1 Tax=Rhopilema esculentum TaxID=499914 RepID=UPI0031DD4BB9|eukprot:gene10536-19265_t